MASLRRLFQLRNVFKNVTSQYCTQNGTPIRMMTSDIQTFLEATFSCSEKNILSTERKCKEFVSFYSNLTTDDKGLFLHVLSERYGINHDNFVRLAQTVSISQDRGEAVLLSTEERLKQVLIPRYQIMFRQIGRLDGGVKFLVDMRSDVLGFLTSGTSEITVAHYRSLSSALRELISLWFSVGLLNLQRITWQSPCDMVQKVSDYEAVHPIRNWNDIQRRVGLYRRCYVFTHSSMSREPVVVLHTALTQDISSTIHSIIKLPGFWPGGENLSESSSPTISPSFSNSHPPEGHIEDKQLFNTAVFYSITSTQKGLQGVELGNYLIKKVVQELQTEFDHITQFSSLSPIPGFRDWLTTELNQNIHSKDIGEDNGNMFLLESEKAALLPFKSKTHNSVHETLKDFIQSNSWLSQKDLEPILKTILMRLCARYLYKEKRRQYALNPVANFHLGNGAMMWRINWMADMSMRGLTASCGLMVNYRYYLKDTETYSSKYLEDFHIEASQQVLNLVDNV